jgi:hypothetical protein
MSQLTFNYTGRDLKERGMNQAETHANQVHEKWSEKAYDLFKAFLVKTSSPFKIEDFREYVKNLLPAPPSLRAFGGVAMRAAKSGLIKRVGYAKVNNAKAHQANASLWMRV